MRVVMNWDGEEVPEELRALPKGRYLVVAVDDAPALTEEQEAALEAALASVRAGRGVERDHAQARIDPLLRR